MSKEEATSLLRSRGLKVTPQRVAILRVLLNGGHFNITQLLNEVRRVEPSISISTVYNTLMALVNSGILRSFEANGKTWYEVKKQPHINIMCEDTGEITDVYVDTGFIENELSKRGIKVKDLNIIVYGDCAGASKPEASNQR
jgi:Fe2+ or Zn2+ uptake regulation protein